MAKTKRAGLRRDVLKILASVKRGISAMHGVWNVSGTVYGNGSYRPREQNEYPENNPAEWHKLCESLDDMIEGLTIMRGMAYENYVQVARETLLSAPPERQD
jgi:hypothetical protein